MSFTKSELRDLYLDLKQEVRGILGRLDLLEEQIERLDDFELVDEPGVASSQNPIPPSALAPRPCSGASTDRERVEAAKQTGAFFRKLLAGGPGGESGRGRVKLQNRIYVVVKSIRGEKFNPVRVFNRFSDARELVTFSGQGSEFGDSIFAGFASAWEGKNAVAEAGLDWPASS